jgi:hypothetical protein
MCASSVMDGTTNQRCHTLYLRMHTRSMWGLQQATVAAPAGAGCAWPDTDGVDAREAQQFHECLPRPQSHRIGRQRVRIDHEWLRAASWVVRAPQRRLTKEPDPTIS